MEVLKLSRFPKFSVLRSPPLDVTLSNVKFKYVTVLISIHFIYMSNTYSLSSPFVQQQRLHMHFLEILFVIRCDLDFGEPIDTLSIQVQVCSPSNAAPK